MGEIKRLYIRVALGLDPGKDKAKRKERKDISLFNVHSNTIVASSLALSQVHRAARAGAGGTVERNAGLAFLRAQEEQTPVVCCFSPRQQQTTRPASFRG